MIAMSYLFMFIAGMLAVVVLGAASNRHPKVLVNASLMCLVCMLLAIGFYVRGTP